MRRALNAISMYCLSSAVIIAIDPDVDFNVAIITSATAAAIAYSLWSFFYD